MNDERVVGEIVTKFLINTCRLRPQPSKPAVQAAVTCGQLAAQHTRDDTEADVIPLTTGSVAEFYIEPMISHVGDIDVMYHRSTELAMPAGHPPPTQLPDEFHNYVRLHEIVDSHLPGYVYLKLRYLLTEGVDDGKYNAVDCDRGSYTSTNRNEFNIDAINGMDSHAVHGPALQTVYGGSLLSSDAVPCARCLVWPPQAADWPTRHRNHDWPDSATVDCVVTCQQRM